MIEASQTEILNQLKNRFNRIAASRGATVVVTGGSGMGKSHLARSFISGLSPENVIYRMSGRVTPQPSLSAIYEGLYSLISGFILNKEQFMIALRKYIQILPGFGQYITPLINHEKMEAIATVLRRAGFDDGVAPNQHIIRFLKELAGPRQVVIFCDNLQWLDTASLDCITSFMESTLDLGWFILLVYNDRVESWNDNVHKLITLQLEKHAGLRSVGTSVYQVRRCDAECISDLCKEILGTSCEFTSEQFVELHRISGGIPFYVKSILTTLFELGYVQKVNGVAISVEEWTMKDITRSLHDSISLKLKQLYSAVPHSRTALEIASVLGDIFSDEYIDGILNIRDSYQILSSIEHQFWLIRYVLETRNWQFDHSLIRDTIYQSLGKLCSKMHYDAAAFLERTDPTSCLAIAHHYLQAGERKLSREWSIREVERLLEVGLFRSAFNSMTELWDELLIEASDYSSAELQHIFLVYGMCLYYARQYEAALAQFIEASKRFGTGSFMVHCDHWLGRCLMKLGSREEFEQAISHLEKALGNYDIGSEMELQGDILADLVVANARLNRFSEASSKYTEAENYYRKTNDRVGMAKLQRKCVVVFDSAFAAPLLERVATTFEQLSLLHERTMALNNSATEYLYLNNVEKARILLRRAVDQSRELCDFGISYLHNNLGIVELINGKFTDALSFFQSARRRTTRKVEMLIVDINMSITYCLAGEADRGIEELWKCSQRASKTGERVYTLPIAVNLGRALINSGKHEEAIRVLQSYQPSDVDHCYFFSTNVMWFAALKDAFQLSSESHAYLRLREKYSQYSKANPPISVGGYAFVEMQFWSD